jgi:glycosyltransferase involved in cell wall biosynthesis
MTPRISVVVPLYNKAPYVQRTLDSIARQTLTNFEVIVVNDGSTDAGAEIVRSFPDQRVRLLTQPNLGPGAARNRGIEEARADLIAFLDADDEWLPEYLEEGVAILDQAEPDVACVTLGYVTEPGSNSHLSLWRRRGLTEGTHRITPESSAQRVVHMLAFMSPCSTISRTKVLRSLGGFYAGGKCNYGEDAHLWLKVLLNERVEFGFKPLARFHVENSSLSKNLPGVRPVEPFLLHPEELYAVCPPELEPLLAEVLMIRALKTACVLGYWGYWREAKDLVRGFNAPSYWRYPYYAPSLICRTPLGGMIGRMLRRMSPVVFLFLNIATHSK